MSLEQKIEFTIPCHWNKEVIDRIMVTSQQSSRSRVGEIYGTLANESIAHGRHPESVLDVSRADAIDFRNYVKNKFGISFVYVINAPRDENPIEQKEKEYIDWIVAEFNTDAIMISSPVFMRYVFEKYPKTSIFVSTIAGVKNIVDLKKYLQFKPGKIVGHHDLNRNLNDLAELKKICDKESIDLELMATESCLRGCLLRDAHYGYLAAKNKDLIFHFDCNSRKIKNPHELLKSNFIRPEDISYYTTLGINKFKITGRSKPAEWLPEVIEAYLNESYSGNLIRLLGIDPSYHFEDWMHINNKALDGFIQEFPQNQSEESENLFCRDWINKLFKNNDFSIDGVDYGISRAGFLEVLKASGTALTIINKYDK